MFSFFAGGHSDPAKKRQLAPVVYQERPQPMNPREQGEVNLIKSLLASYFAIVKKQIADVVPKTIMHFLVNKSKQCMQRELVTQLYKEGQFEELLCESPEVAHKRRQNKDLIAVLKKALDIVNEVRDFKT